MKSNDKDIQLFQAAFYADLNAIKLLVDCHEDLIIEIPIPEGYRQYWESQSIIISIVEILNWLAYGLYRDIDEGVIASEFHHVDGEISRVEIDAATYYYHAMECLDWICNEFLIINYRLKDYSSFRLLRHFLFDDEGWYDNWEIEEFIEKGGRRIDVELINEAEKGNGITTYDLIKKGANYKVNPDEDDFCESALLEILESDSSFHLLHLIIYLHDIDKFDEAECYKMLESLYQAGVGNYILGMIS